MLNPKTEVHPMIRYHFEADRAALGTQYTEEHWDAGSGLSPEALRTELLAIAVKTRLYEKVLASAELDVDRRDFFPEKLHHDFLLSRMRGRWMKDFRAREMAVLLAETDAATKGLCYTGDADFGHTSPDWEAVLALGIPGLRARVLAARDEKTALTEAQRLFYACTADTLTATIGFIARLADATDRLAADGDEKMRLVSSSLRHLTVGAPETLLEAMQLSVIFYNLQCNVERDALGDGGGLYRHAERHGTGCGAVCRRGRGRRGHLRDGDAARDLYGAARLCDADQCAVPRGAARGAGKPRKIRNAPGASVRLECLFHGALAR